jgi:hypothetical protein
MSFGKRHIAVCDDQQQFSYQFAMIKFRALENLLAVPASAQLV